MNLTRLSSQINALARFLWGNPNAAMPGGGQCLNLSENTKHLNRKHGGRRGGSSPAAENGPRR